MTLDHVALEVAPDGGRPFSRDSQDAVALVTASHERRPGVRNGALIAMDDPQDRATRTAPLLPSFVVVDHDSDTWRLYDGSDSVVRVSRVAILDCDVTTDWLVVEGCHLVPQGDMSVSAPFTLSQLQRLASNAAARGVEIRTLPNRRIPRAWSEVEPDVAWDARLKERDAEVWYRWLTANPRRLASCRRWSPEPIATSGRVTSLRAAAMSDVNMVRQWRQYPKTSQAQGFAGQVRDALFVVVNADLDAYELLKRLGCKWKPRSRYQLDARDSLHVCNAYCLARDPRTGEARPGLSAKLVRRVCGLYANGFPNQVRSDLRYHGRVLGRPTQMDRDFVDLVLRFNRAEV